MTMMTKTAARFGMLALTVALMGLGTVATAKDGDDTPITIRGCVVPGEAKDSYLLTDVEVQGPGVAPSDAYYRFDSTSGLASQVGYRVEIKGKADLDDPDKGKLKVKVKDDKVETKVSTEGKRVTTEQNLWFGTEGSARLKTDIVSYKFHPDHVQRIPGGACAMPKK
jgi:hypothetical protein